MDFSTLITVDYNSKNKYFVYSGTMYHKIIIIAVLGDNIHFTKSLRSTI